MAFVPEDEAFVQSLTSQAERSDLEFKAAENNFSTEKILSYCAAIANDGGGRLVLGVTDQLPRTVIGTSTVTNPSSMENHIHEKLGIQVVIRVALYDNKRVIVFQIPSRRPGMPIAYDGRYLTRVGESLTSMGPYRIAEILEETQVRLVARRVAEHFTAERVADLLDVDAYFRLIPDTRPPAGLESELEMMARRGLVVLDTGGTYSITALGALFLARDLTVFPDLQWRRVRFLRYSGSDRVNAVLERFDVRGYGLCFEDIIDLVAANAPVREHIEEGLRKVTPLYPPTAIREFVANAMIHQDLAETGVQLTIEIFADRIEIRNAGRPLIEITRFVDESVSRNAELSEIMRLAGICEVRGSGVDRALEQIEDLLRPAPLFKAETAATSVILYADLAFEDMTIEERVWATFLHCSVRYAAGGRLTNTSLRERFGLTSSKTTLASQTIAATLDAKLIKLDPRAGSSRKHARYIPFYAAG